MRCISTIKENDTSFSCSQGNVTITVDLIDFFDVGPADPQPGGSLSIIDYGADPTGAKDSSAAVTAAIAAGAFRWKLTASLG
jgi:hypothetical protein